MWPGRKEDENEKIAKSIGQALVIQPGNLKQMPYKTIVSTDSAPSCQIFPVSQPYGDYLFHLTLNSHCFLYISVVGQAAYLRILRDKLRIYTSLFSPGSVLQSSKPVPVCFSPIEVELIGREKVVLMVFHHQKIWSSMFSICKCEWISGTWGLFLCSLMFWR